MCYSIQAIKRIFLVGLAGVVVCTVTVRPFPFNPAAQKNQANPKPTEKAVEPTLPNGTAKSPKAETPEVASKGEPKPVRVTELPPSDTWYKAYVIATIFLAGVGFFGVRAAYKTLKAIERQALSMRRQTTHLRRSVIVAGRTARATKIAAEAAKASADAMVNSERAWVIPELVPMAVKRGKVWQRQIGPGWFSMTVEEVRNGEHLRHRLKFTNMGRTPAQIFAFEIRYSCLQDGAGDLPTQSSPHYVEQTEFAHMLGAGEGIELQVFVDVQAYMNDDWEEIKNLRKTAVFHGWVKYQHIFSSTDLCFADFCYCYTVSMERLSRVGRYTKQRQEKAN